MMSHSLRRIVHRIGLWAVAACVIGKASVGRAVRGAAAACGWQGAVLDAVPTAANGRKKERKREKKT